MEKSAVEQQLEQALQQLPSLPQLVMEVLAMIDAGEIEITQVANKIGRDQALTARVLRVANSSYYGYSRHIASLKDAGVMLGIHTLRDIVLAASVVSRFPPDEPGVLDRSQLWHHAEMTGGIARRLASRGGLDCECAFTAGLLHDIGKLALDTCFPEVYHCIVLYSTEQQCSLSEAEMALLGFDHCQAGFLLAQHWKLPQQIRVAIKKHHQPDVEPASTIADLVHIADILSHNFEDTKKGESTPVGISSGALKRLGLDEHFFDEWRLELGVAELESAQLFGC